MLAHNDRILRRVAREIGLMARALVALVFSSASVEALADTDFQHELSRNQQLASSPLDVQERQRQDVPKSVRNRLQLLRHNLLWSFLILGSAILLAVLIKWVWPSHVAFPRVMGAASIFCFAWATLGRLGWSGQSWKGDSVIERLDDLLFRMLYWVGTLLGTLALV